MRLIALLLVLGAIFPEQQIDFALKNLNFKGLEFSTTQAEIVKVVGDGKRVETNYECGFFASDQEGAPYYQLAYPGFTYIGGDKEKVFYLENVYFDANGSIKLKYLDKELTGATTEGEFVKMFGDTAKERMVTRNNANMLLLYSNGSDDGGIFWFKNGRLFKFEYWTPC